MPLLLSVSLLCLGRKAPPLHGCEMQNSFPILTYPNYCVVQTENSLLKRAKRDTFLKLGWEPYISGTTFGLPRIQLQTLCSKTFFSSSFEWDVGPGIGPRASDAQCRDQRWEAVFSLVEMSLTPLRLPDQICCGILASAWPQTLHTEWMCKSWDPNQ